MITDGKLLVKRHEALKSTPERTNLEAVCKDIEEFIRPGRGAFTGYRDKGQRGSQRRFEDTAINACNNFEAGMYGMGTSKANRWFSLRTESGQEDDDISVAQWLEATEDIVSAYLQRPESQFYRHLKAFYGDLGAFGTACLFSHEPEPGVLVFRAVSLAHLVFSQNALGIIDIAIESYSLSAIAAHRRFNRDGIRCTEAERLQEKHPFQPIKFLHVVQLNDHIDERKTISPEGKPFISQHVELSKSQVCETKGFEEFPYHIARWSQEPDAVYGRGIGFDIISTVMGLNAMKRSNLKAAQNIADPTLLLPDEGAFGGRVRTHPGDHVYGGVSPEGRPLVYPLQTGGNVPIAMEMMNQERAEVREAFFFDLMQLAQRPNMTATEVVQRQEEKLRLLGPHLGLLESDLLEPIIRRTARFVFDNGFVQIPTPETLQSGVEIEFVSPLAMAQKMADASAIQQGVAFAGQIVPFAPEVNHKVDWGEAVDHYFRARGVPASVLRGADEAAALAQQEQQMQMIQAAPGLIKEGADAELSLARAESERRGQ